MHSFSKPTVNRDPADSLVEPSFRNTLWSKGAEWIAALGGALCIGALVGIVNYPYGLSSALLAGGKQALWTALVAGLLTRFCRFLCTQTGFRLLPPMVCGVLCPSALAVAGVAVVHHLEGTANPWGSILITVLLAPPGFWLIAHNIRRANNAALRDANAAQATGLDNNSVEA